MSIYFGKCFGPSTPAPEPSFWLRCPTFLLSKFTSQLKLIQSVVRVRILGICVTSSVFRVLHSGFWVSKYQFSIPRDLFPGSLVSGFHVPESQFESLGCQGPVFQGPRVPGSHLQESQDPDSRVSGSQGLGVPGLRVLGSRISGLRVPGPGSQVLILDYAKIKDISTSNLCSRWVDR